MAFDWSRPGKSLVTGVSQATGVDEDKVKTAAMVVDPVSALTNRAVDAKEVPGLAKKALTGLTERKPVYEAKAPDMIQAPAMPTSGPVQVQGVQPMKAASLAAVAPTAAPSFSGSTQATQMQGGLAQQLAAMSRGEGPSLANEQLKQAQANNLAATFSMMASQRGGPTAAGTRGAMMTAADINAQSARDAAMARIKEQTEAQGLLAGVTSGMRAGDVAEQKLITDVNLQNTVNALTMAVKQGEMDQRTAEAIYNAQVQQVRDNATLAQQHNELMAKYVGMGLNAAEANQRAQLDLERIRAGIPLGPSTADQLARGLSTAAPFISMMNPAAGAAASQAPTIVSGLSSYDNQQNADAQSQTNKTGRLFPTR